MLKVKEAVKEFNGFRAVNRCSIDVPANKITGLIGPNGAGKTTLFNLISGGLTLDTGEVWFNQERIDQLPAHKIVHKGLYRTFQIPRALEKITTIENLMLVPANQLGEKIWNSWFRNKQVKAEEQKIKARAEEVLGFLELTHVKYELAGNLSVGQKKLLELGRALMSDPDMILLDEPAAGVNPTLMKKIAENIRKLQQQGKTFLLIEHNMDLIMDICDKVIVMNNGEHLIEGTPQEVRNNKEVLEAYLGVEEGHNDIAG
jgi:branched-chain amino acid transport system ATP-binding protein/neutral amino acid transport system ATP-binding protein